MPVKTGRTQIRMTGAPPSLAHAHFDVRIVD